MYEDSCVNFQNQHCSDKKSTSNNARIHYGDDQNKFYTQFLNDNTNGSRKKCSEFETSSTPFQSYVKQIETLKSYIDTLTKEHNGLKQQCRAAIQQWNKEMKEKKRIEQQRDDALKKVKQEMTQNKKKADDLTRLTEERNSAVHEYNLIMSERDTVHKEMEKLNEELGQYQKKLKLLDLEKKSLIEDLENQKKENIRSIDKEILMKQMYRERFNDAHISANSFHQHGMKAMNSSNTNAKWSSSSSGFSSGWTTQYGNLRNPLSISSTNSNINSLQTFNTVDTKQIGKPINFSTSNSSSISTMANYYHGKADHLSDVELELRKQIQQLEYDYSSVNFEFQNCLLHNEKVVQERESIKTLCDKLRRERDRAIRDRAEAIQELNDFKLRIDSNVQVKKFMDDLNDENNLPSSHNSTGKTSRQYNNTCSKDSAISTDIQDTTVHDYESLNLQLTANFRYTNNKNPWGFSVRCTKQTIVVCAIDSDSPAEEKLKLNDIILSINSTIINDEEVCNEMLRNSDKDLKLIVQRRKQLSSVLNIDLDCYKNEHGLLIENAFIIKKLQPGSAAAKNEHIAAGDRLLSINGKTLENSTIHDVMQLLREDKLLLKVYKESFRNQDYSSAIANSSSSVLLNGQHDQIMFDSQSHHQPNSKSLNNNMKLTYQKDDLHLTACGKQQLSNYSSNVAHHHYQSIKRSSKKSKTLLNDSSSSFGIECDKSSPNLFDKTLSKLFKKSIKSKSDKKEEKLKKLSNEKETLENFNRLLDNLSEQNPKKKPFADSNKSKGVNERSNMETENINSSKNAGGTWPSCKSNANLLLTPTSDMINKLSSTVYVKKKERKSPAIFANYNKNESNNQNGLDIDNAYDSQKHRAKELNEEDENGYGKISKDFKIFNDYQQQYGIIQQTHKPSSRTMTPVQLENNSYKSLLHGHHHQTKSHNHHHHYHNERSLSSSISSYSSKDNYHKQSNHGRKYTLNHDTISKSFNVSSANNSSTQFNQSDYEMKKSKEKKYLESGDRSLSDLQNEKDSKDMLFPLSRNSNNSSFDFYSITNKRQLITSNLTHDLEPYFDNNSSVDQGLAGSNSALGPDATDQHCGTSNTFILSPNVNSLPNAKKSSPINIDQLKALNHISINSPSYHLNEHLFSDSPSSHYAALSSSASNHHHQHHHQKTASSNAASHHYTSSNSKDSNNYYSSFSNKSVHNYTYANQTSRFPQTISNPLESIGSLSSNLCPQDDYMSASNKNQRFYISSNNSVASKLSNCSMDSTILHSNAINSSSGCFKKTTTNESLDSASYSNVQNLRNLIHQNDLKLISNKTPQQSTTVTTVSRNEPSLGLDATNEQNRNASLDSYSAVSDNTKPGDTRQICIEKSKAKSLGIQIDCGKLSNDSKNNNQGIFVSCVNEGSLAQKVGLKVGDQLLEICGINMRSANKDAATSVLRQCGQTVMMKVQYNPDKFFGKDDDMTIDQHIDESNLSKDTKSNLETNLDHQMIDQKVDDDKKAPELLEATLKNFHIIDSMKSDHVQDEMIDKDDEEESYSDKCLYF